MKNNSRIQSYFPTVLKELGFLLRKNKGRLTPSDTRRALYVFKIFDFVWFDSSPPSNYEEKFQVVFNTGWEWKDQISDIVGIVNLNEDALKYISEKLQTPNWVSSGLSFPVSIEEVLDSND